MSNGNIAAFFNDNPETTKRLYRRAVSAQCRSNVRECDAEDAVQDAYLALLEKEAHENAFEREGNISQRRFNKLSRHALRDELAKQATDGLGRYNGAKTRKELFVERCLSQGVELEDLPEDAKVNQKIYRSAENAGTVSYSGMNATDHDAADADFWQPEVVCDNPSPEELAVAKLMIDEARQALIDEYAHNERKQRIALRSLDLALEGHGRNAIAEFEGISPNTQKNRLTEHRKVMRKVFKASEPKPAPTKNPAPGGYIRESKHVASSPHTPYIRPTEENSQQSAPAPVVVIRKRSVG